MMCFWIEEIAACMESIEKKIKDVLQEKVNPLLETHSGGAELVSFVDGVATVAFRGACSGCPSARQTLEDIVESALTEAIPEVTGVELASGITDDMIAMAKKILGAKAEK